MALFVTATSWCALSKFSREIRGVSLQELDAPGAVYNMQRVWMFLPHKMPPFSHELLYAGCPYCCRPRPAMVVTARHASSPALLPLCPRFSAMMSFSGFITWPHVPRPLFSWTVVGLCFRPVWGALIAWEFNFAWLNGCGDVFTYVHWLRSFFTLWLLHKSQPFKLSRILQRNDKYLKRGFQKNR